MGMHSDEVLDEKDFPRRYLGFSPCYRREAGAHSKDIKGLIRVHEFFKFEQLILCKADHELSVSFHEELNRNTEEFIETLGIPYHTVANCGGDLGLGQVKKYDVELWVPKREQISRDRFGFVFPRFSMPSPEYPLQGHRRKAAIRAFSERNSHTDSAHPCISR